MRRQHPFLSPTGIVLAVFLTGVLTFLLWKTGGQMFSPGPLTAQSLAGQSLGGVTSHAEITDCATCHQPLKTRQAALCLDCHTNVKDQLDNSNGLHAKFDTGVPCFSCHSDHKGQDFDPILAGLANFDHSITQFSLIWHQVDYSAAPLECASCHTGDDFSINQQACKDCHSAHDVSFMSQHQQEFGMDCLACHDGVDRMANFDHAQTALPLEGQHVSLPCAKCHVDNRFAGLPAQCAACHTEPDLHAGLFDPQCDACHTPNGWTPATLGSADFDHLTDTRFSLIHHRTDFSGAIINCATCHETSLTAVETTVCTACHAQADLGFMTAHEQQFGTECLACHDGIDRMQDFDHARFFVLDGRHAEIECTSCHQNQVFSGTTNECVQCHAEPSIHAGLFGLKCESCHSTTAWTPATLKVHTFPLDHGGEGVIACQTCHVATYLQYTCDSCHDPAEMKKEHDDKDIFNITNCVECHPTGLKEE